MARRDLHGANGDAFVYDERDHVCERRGRGGTITYRYNGRDQLAALDAPGLAYRAEHDALGRRVSKTAAGRTTRFYWDGDRLAAEVDADGALRVYVYPDEGALVPMLFVDYTSVDADPASGKVYEVFTDHLGTPERIRDADGNLVWQARIAPYGRAEVLVGAGFHQPFRFPGHYYDAETGLHENRFRSYAPELGRYLQTDPIGLSGGTNLYAYTWNPLVDVDIRGLCPDDVEDCPHKPVTPDAEAPLDPNGRHGMPPHGQTIPERAATMPAGSVIRDYALRAPEIYFYDPATGTYPRREGAGRDRRTDYPSGFRQSTLDAMAAQHTVEGQALRDTPRLPGGAPIPHSDLTWLDPDVPGRIIEQSESDPISFDHRISVVEMDNVGATVGDRRYDPGSDTSRAERIDFFHNPDNLRPMLRSENSALGGGVHPDGTPMRYVQTTGPRYSHR